MSAQPLKNGNLQYLLAANSGMDLGNMGEQLAARMLETSGYFVYQVCPGDKIGDLNVIDFDFGRVIKIEVKTARRSSDRKWRFTLWKRGCTDHRHSDVVMLIVVTPAGRAVPFIIPVSELFSQRQAFITSHPDSYAGKLAKYRQSYAHICL